MESPATTAAKFHRSKSRPPMQSQPDPVESEFPEDPVIEAPVAPASIVKAENEAKREALAAPKYAASLTVIDQGTLDHAHAYLRAVKVRQGQIEASFDPQISQANALHKSLLAEKKKFTAPLEDAERIVKRTIAGYLAEEDRKRREAEAERSRVEAEARRVAEQGLKKAEKAMANGDQAKADAIIDQTDNRLNETLAAAPEVPDAPIANGLTLTETWKFSIVDPNAVPREYLCVDEVKIGKIVRALKSEAKIPGVRIYSERSVSSRIN